MHTCRFRDLQLRVQGREGVDIALGSCFMLQHVLARSTGRHTCLGNVIHARLPDKPANPAYVECREVTACGTCHAAVPMRSRDEGARGRVYM